MTTLTPGGLALSGGGGRRPTRRLLAPAVFALAVAAPLTVAAPLAVSAGANTAGWSDRETDLVAFARAVDAAWNAHDLEAAFALFATDAVVTFDYGPSGDYEDGPVEYRGVAAPFSLRAGVAVLTEAGVRVDPGGLKAAPIVFGGAPATMARWPYQRDTLYSALPPELGTDAVVLREGRILAYTRTLDPASRAARARALDRAMSAVATLTARPAVVAEGAPPRAPEATDSSWPLRLAGVGAVAALLVRWRRHAHRG